PRRARSYAPQPGPLGGFAGPRSRIFIFALDQQPLGLCPSARTLECEAAPQLLAVQDEYRMAAREGLGPRNATALLIGAAVPDDHRALAERALEVVVVLPAVLNLDRH